MIDLDDDVCVSKIADYLTIVEVLNTINSIDDSSNYIEATVLKAPLHVDCVEAVDDCGWCDQE